MTLDTPPRIRRVSRTGIIVAAVPGLLALILFYSLAIHMHRSLGGWPASIGEAGFPPALLAHATMATSYFSLLLLLCLFALPVAIVVCLCVARWRRVVPYLALFALVFLANIAFMQLAPERYLYWWWD